MATVNLHPAFTKLGGQDKQQEEGIANSSFLQQIKYDPDKLQLTVTMKTGAEYVHSNISPSTYQDMMQSPSKGSFYAKTIKGSGASSRVIDKNVGPEHKRFETPQAKLHTGGNTRGRNNR